MSFFKKSGLGVCALICVPAAFALCALMLYGASALVLSGYIPETLGKPLAYFAEGAGIMITAVAAMRLRKKEQPALCALICGSMCVVFCITAIILHGEYMTRALWLQPVICSGAAVISIGLVLNKKGKKRRNRRH